MTRTTRSFHHYTVGGELEVEEAEVLAEVVDEVSCRWCGTGASVVEYDGSADGPSSDEAGVTEG